MRLLECNAHGELSLTENLHDNIPPYAILSHIWGPDDEEVTFQDLISGSGKSKAGYAKIQFCGKRAQKDALQYFWVDTCCIDKANHVELSEAINSMFRWFRNAEKCYVYLSDVSAHADGKGELTWKSAFLKSRWFTLAWTLQELLAPMSVEFFSQEGEFLGDKVTLEQDIHEVTGIPVPALRGAPLSDFSVDERLRWTAKRHAARKEDLAYSLLGIFGVFMPLLYGEGNNAFARLRRKIERMYPNKYLKESLGYQAGEDDDELASVRSVESLSSTATGSSTTLVVEVLAAANEFSSHLLEDQTLIPLFSKAFDLITADRMQRNIKRLLKLYAIDLRQEARSDIEKEAVQLILTRASYVAYCVRRRYDKSVSEKTDRFERLSGVNSGKRALLEDYLRGKTKQTFETDGDVDDHASDSGMSSGEEADQPGLNDLDQVKAFMFESAAYRRFKQSLKDFVLPRREPKQQDSTSTDSPGSCSLDIWDRCQLKIMEVTHGLRMLLRPLVPPGHERITWICGCGDHRYADVREYKHGEASTLQAILRKSIAVTNAHGTDGSNPNHPQPPTKPHLPDRNSTAKTSFRSVPTSGNVYETGQVTTNDAIDSPGQGSANAQSDQMYLLLCLTFGGVSTLEQLDIRDLGNDQYLWEIIREHYHSLHRKAQWHQKLSMAKRLSEATWLSWVSPAIDLTTANSIEFVRFQLVPIGMDIRPWNFHSPSLPPEAEVRVKGTYHYSPCPPFDLDPTCLNGEMLHCLWKPGPHLDCFWLNFFPKKLKETLQYVGSKPEVNTAWGIHVVEGVNWASVTFLGFILLAISAVLGIIYSAVTHDVGGGFGMSAFLSTLPALGICLLQLRSVR